MIFKTSIKLEINRLVLFEQWGLAPCTITRDQGRADVGRRGIPEAGTLITEVSYMVIRWGNGQKEH